MPGGQETFSFTANDLPPGALARRLLAAGVRVVLTHMHRDAASPVDGHSKSAFDSASRSGPGGRATARSNSSNAGGLVVMGVDGQELPTPGTEEEGITSGDDAANERDNNARGDVNSVQGRISRSGGRDPVAGTPSSELDWLQIAVMDNDVTDSEEARAWELRLASMAGSKSSVGACSISTPLLGNDRPSPVRSCPRAAVSRTDSFFGESADDVAGATGLPRWASAKIWASRGPPRSVGSLTPTTQPAEKRPPRGDVPSIATNGRAAPMGRNCQTPPPGTPRSFLDTTVATCGASEPRLRSSRDSGRGGKTVGSSERPRQEARNPWVALTISPASPVGLGTRTADAVSVKDITPRAKPSMFCWNGGKDNADSNHMTVHSTGAEKDGAAVRRLLKSAAERSFEDPPSSRHALRSQSSDSDTGRSDRGLSGSFSESDGEKASRVARALAGWVDSGIQPTPAAELSRPLPALGDRRVIVRRSEGGGMNASGRFIETEDMTSIPPLKRRGWPPPRPVVAGEMDIHDALMSGEEGVGRGQQRRAVRKWGSTGTSWGEEAKLALARKRLQWEK